MPPTRKRRTRKQTEHSEMPPTRKRRTRKQAEHSEIRASPESEEPDRVDQCATLYPAFCTEQIPLEILDELIDEAEKGLRDIVDEEGVPGHSLCILDTEDLDSIVHGSRRPMQPFESPFIGMTDDQVRSWMDQHPHPNFAADTFTILDGDTIRNKTCRIGYNGYDDRDRDKMLITDFWASLMVRITIEMAEISWWELDTLETGEVYGRKYLEKTKPKTSELEKS